MRLQHAAHLAAQQPHVVGIKIPTLRARKMMGVHHRAGQISVLQMTLAALSFMTHAVNASDSRPA